MAQPTRDPEKREGNRGVKAANHPGGREGSGGLTLKEGEAGARACIESLDAAETRLPQGAPGGPRGQVRVRWEVRDGELRCPASPRRGSRDQHSEQRQGVSRLPEQAPRSPTPPPVTAHGRSESCFGKIY